MNVNVIRSLVKHGYAFSPEQIDHLILHHDDYELGAGALSSPHASQQNITNGLKSHDHETQIAALKSPNITPEIVNDFYHNGYHPSIASHVLHHPLLSKENIDNELNKPRTHSVNNAWHRPDLTHEQIVRGINNPNSSLDSNHISGILGRHPQHIDSLFHKDASDRMKLIGVKRREATQDHLGNAYFDKSFPLSAKAYLMQHRNTPRSVIEHGMRHSNEVVSTFAKVAAKDRGILKD